MCVSGLSAEQEAWLESVSYGNISTDWAPLSVNQSGYLMINVQTFEQLTRTANYPYHQAGDVYLQFCTTLTHPGYNYSIYLPKVYILSMVQHS